MLPLAVAAGLITGLFGLALMVAAVDLTAAAPEGSATCVPAASQDQIPAGLLPLYLQAAGAYGLGPDGWAWLAAVNRVETDFGRDLSPSASGAIGWMQFEPATWATYGVDGNGDGRRDANDPADAIPAAARYLSALGAPADWEAAIRGYNGGPLNERSAATLGYWQNVRAVVAGLTTGGCVATGAVRLAPGERAQIAPDGRAAAPAGAPLAVRAMIAAANQLIGRPYVFGGGHADFTLAAGYDCSSSVSWALHGAGFLAAPEDSTSLEAFGAPGPGVWVTIYANPDHAFVYIAGIRLDTSPQPGDGADIQLGPRWRPATRATAGFIVRHPPGL